MKTIKFFLIFAALAVFAVACDDDGTKIPPPEETTLEDGTYEGILSIFLNGVLQENVSESRVKLEVTETGVNIIFVKAKFSEDMELVQELRLDGISTSDTGIDGRISLEGKDIIPTNGKVEMKDLKVTEFGGWAVEELINFQMLAGEYDIRYTGTLTEEPPKPLDAGLYFGHLKVTLTDGTVSEKDNCWVSFYMTSPTEVVLNIVDLEFPPQTEEEISLAVYVIKAEEKGKGSISIKGDKDLGTYTKYGDKGYTIKELSGTVTEEEMTFKMSVDGYPMEFSGKLFSPSVRNYSGTMEVTQTDGSVYKQEQAITAKSLNSGTVTMIFYDARFASNMPITLTMTVEEVGLHSIQSGYAIKGDGLVPLALGGEFPQYTITGLNGTLTDTGLEFTMTCGTFPVKYSGTLVVNE